jgi:tetratricopeptide (TPR) repeat protein
MIPRLLTLWFLTTVTALLAADNATNDRAAYDAVVKTGWEKLRSGDAGAAMGSFEEAIVLKKEMPDAFNGRATARLAKDDLVGALADFTEAIRLNPKWAMPYIGRARVHLIRSEPKKALAYLNSAAVLKQANGPDLYLLRGVAHAQLSNDTAAVDDFTQAIELSTRPLPEARERRALAYLALGRQEDALLDASRLIRDDAESDVGYFVRSAIRFTRGEFDASLSDGRKAAALGERAGLTLAVNALLARRNYAEAAQELAPQAMAADAQEHIVLLYFIVQRLAGQQPAALDRARFAQSVYRPIIDYLDAPQAQRADKAALLVPGKDADLPSFHLLAGLALESMQNSRAAATHWLLASEIKEGPAGDADLARHLLAPR